LYWYDAIAGGTLLATTNYDGFYSSPPLTASKTYYVSSKKITCGIESERVPVTITVNTLTSGSIGVDQSICSGNIPAAFTNSVGTGVGTITYQWQKSPDNTTFINIPTALSAAYSETSALTVKTYYRRVITSTLNGVTCSAISNVIAVNINPIPTFTSTSANVCKGIQSTTLNYTGTNLTPTVT